MQKTILYLSLALLFSAASAKAQNLVPNGDFESYTLCPNDDDQLYLAYPWYSPNDNSSDYFNACANWSGIGFNPDVPVNTHGVQSAHSGNGYIGLNMTPPISYFEYASVKLLQPMEIGQQYCVSFWVSLSDEVCWSSNMLGVHFTPDTIYTPNNHIDIIPTMEFETLVDQQQEWVQIQGQYTSPYGGEQFLTLGIFHDGFIQTLQFCNEPFGVDGTYFYIDDVTVELMSEESACAESDNFGEEEFVNVFTPNGDGINDVWELTTVAEHELTILNRWGNIVYQNTGTSSVWTASDVVDGTYFYHIKYKDETKHGHITVVK